MAILKAAAEAKGEKIDHKAVFRQATTDWNTSAEKKAGDAAREAAKAAKAATKTA